MDRLDRMQLFVRIVERGSFTAAAADFGLSRSSTTEAIKRLEADLGARLLNRTTRHLTTTLEGQAFYLRCKSILADVEEAEASFRDAQPHGLLRVDAHPLLTRTFLLPKLSEFLTRYPKLDLQLGQGDRLVDLVREGVDCVIRAGQIADSTLIVRRLASITEITCASPTYLERHGHPDTIDDLQAHSAVGFISSRTGTVLPLEFVLDGDIRQVTLAARVTVNNSDTMADLARYGFGLIQAPRYRLQHDLDTGVLVEVLPRFRPPPIAISALYPQSQQTSLRLRLFLDWITEIFQPGTL
ncbi:LysR family transcriptional regulator [Devosia sp. ZW T5_3]|uniref:LysR family transcriptional regulator n=1 Tax=Devosia sp. ZW T5_3 TaxID=3378085 RepID=UPI003854CDAE